ncbi:TPA: hypothetical protein PTV68_002465 [Clostridium botulinum]|uniref:hypothetical protein n=1 Tax=Clostridium botulinum TaxID=1491 RepID=UPI0029A52FB3|nr:hypothetical protein [Clostridium botulinum]HDK7188726.1 hypothetical protein [Clostridium botulinum]HDK7215645.1 hypothetical protein [Clostridium botulinum]HDK7231399.1 hypothetical protein [Clostridium botulinum]HDK7261149.1 hypothetical protein [Clostridium botulinum]
MSITLEEKFRELLELVIRTAEIWKPLAVKKEKEIRLMKATQIILTTITTILLGLKLTGIYTSIAFISSTIATACTVWYNVENNSRLYISIYKYSTVTTSLAREILFYSTTVKPLEEEKYQEYVERFFNLKAEFEKENISLAESLMKNTQNMIKAIEAK